LCPVSPRKNEICIPVRDLFITVFGYQRSDLIVDTADQMGGIPDLSVLAPSGIPGSAPIRWLVVEVKDEPGVFLNAFVFIGAHMCDTDDWRWRRRLRHFFNNDAMRDRAAQR
jgi:hypothetical protein